MKIFYYKDPETAKNNAIIIIGIGLIGSAIYNKLKQLLISKEIESPLDWNMLHTIPNQIYNNCIQLQYTDYEKIHWIWAAGKAGFNANEQEANSELQLFEKSIEKICEIQNKITNSTIHTFHLISSAGGLFEGQQVISKQQKPSPLRPYGILKLNQEILLEKNIPENIFIYRLSTVYGYYKKGYRTGLPAALLFNTICNKKTEITAHAYTLRDFIWIEDVANYISTCILTPHSRGEKIQFVVSGKPTSIFEICILLERITRKKIQTQYASTLSNSQNIVFSAQLKNKNLQTTDIETCVRKMYHKIIM